MNKPYFFWDYNLSEKKVRRLLKESDQTTRRLIITRILESATYSDVWKYLNPQEVVEIFPGLQLKPQVKQAWTKALHAWGYYRDS